MVRKALSQDVSRIAEISVFAKRAAYRPIFKDDLTSFGHIQVLPLALELAKPGALEGFFVYERDFVRGFSHICTPKGGVLELKELYVDPLLQGEGCGRALMEHFLQLGQRLGRQSYCLWVLEDNHRARAFYSRFGFAPSGRRQPEEGTDKWKLLYLLSL